MPLPENQFPNDPISKIVWLPAAMLRANHYNPNHVMEPELRLLEFSVVKTGWVQPILVSADYTIIDGFHRWRLSMESKEIGKRYGGLVPCVVLPISEAEAMLLTVRINRAKGTHAAVRMSDLVKALVDKHGVDQQQIAVEIGATKEEVELLYQDSLFLARNLENYRYSKSWIPAENGKKVVRGGAAKKKS